MLFLALEVVAYHGLSRAMEIRTVKMEQMSHLYVVIFAFYMYFSLMALFAAHSSKPAIFLSA